VPTIEEILLLDQMPQEDSLSKQRQDEQKTPINDSTTATEAKEENKTAIDEAEIV
jgi:hypothetical protein